MDAKARVAWNIRKLRVERQVSQEAFAVDAGIDRTYVSRLERGMENPTVAVLESIAAALDVGIEALFPETRPTALSLRRVRHACIAPCTA
jgi:transcriptional regulator with XRE-family HTH domain